MSISNTIKNSISYFCRKSRFRYDDCKNSRESIAEGSVSVMMVSQLETISPPEMHIKIRENMQMKTNHMIT